MACQRHFRKYGNVIGLIIFIYLLLKLLFLFRSKNLTFSESRDEAIDLRVFKTHSITTPSRNTFQIVSGTDQVFSAYRELRYPNFITVIGLSSWRRNESQAMHCNLIDSHRELTMSVKVAALYLLDSLYQQEVQERKLIPAIIVCPLPHSYSPNWISVSVDESKFGMNLLDIVTNHHEGDHLSIAVCTPPLFENSFVGDAEVVEWIEMYRLLGVSLFVMYTTEGKKIRKKFLVFDYYTSVGIIDMVEMTSMDPPSLKEVTSNFVLSECVYRVMRRYEWVVMSEFDSILMPQNPKRRLQQAIVSVKTSNSADGLQAFSFPTTWFLRKQGELTMNVSLYRRHVMDVVQPWGLLLKSEHGMALTSDKRLQLNNMKAKDVAPVAKYCVYREREGEQIGEIEYDDTARKFMPAILKRLEMLKRKLKLR